MGVDVRWEDERGTVLKTIDDPYNLVATLLPDHSAADFPCLRFVDPYGDTVFNQLQLPQLLDELCVLAKRSFDPAVQQHLAALTDLVQSARGRVHSYIRFYGD